MVIHWEDEKLKLQHEDLDLLTSRYDSKLARNVVLRIQQLTSAPHYLDIPQSAKPHSIKDGKKFRYFTVDLPDKEKKRGKWRLAFLPCGDFDLAKQKTITEIEILGIVDPHN